MKAAKNRRAPRLPGKIQRIRLHPKDILWVTIPAVSDRDLDAIRRALIDATLPGQRLLITGPGISIRRLSRHA